MDKTLMAIQTKFTIA
ncbi:host cell division inhibitory peptide Kil, partial [Escherichia coli]